MKTTVPETSLNNNGRLDEILYYCAIMRMTAFPIDEISFTQPPMVFRNGLEWRWQSERREHYNLWISLKGRGSMDFGSKRYDVTPWTAFLFPPEGRLLGLADDPGEEMVNFSLHWLPKTGRSLESGSLPLGLKLYEIDTAQSLIQSLVRRSVGNDPLTEQESHWAALGLLALVWREGQTPARSSADQLIHGQIERILSGGDLFLTTTQLAAEAGLSRAHYSRRFSRITATSPNRFLREQRIRRACNLLKEQDWTIETVAEKIGYSAIYFFSRQFKRMVGRTPGEYRNLERW